MAKKAHIITRPASTEIGSKAVAVCGKVFTYKTTWDDIPADKQICRDCVDTILVAAKEADSVIVGTRSLLRMLQIDAAAMATTLNPKDYDLMLDQIEEVTKDFEQERLEKQLIKADKKRTQSTCTCTWESPEMMTPDPNCPIHGGEDKPEEIVPVAPED